MYAKGLVEEVVPTVAQLPVSTVGQRLDDSLGSWSSLELDDPAPLPPPPSGGGGNGETAERENPGWGAGSGERFLLEGEVF